MAEKTLNTRILLKYDSYENWQKSGLVLKAGEMAIATIPAETGAVKQEPAVVIKVGDGEKTFSALPFIHALAADVANWAKADDKPTYEAKEITGIDAYIADYVEEQMGISVDTDTQYQLVKVDDYNYKLQCKGKTDEAWADVANSAIVIPNDTAAIEALQGLVGETAVATQIGNAIAALDLANTYAAKTHTHEMGEVNGLGDAIADAKKAGTDAQAAADQAQEDVDALAGKVGEVPADKTVVQMIADAQTAATYDDTQVKADIKANADAIDVLEGQVGTLVGEDTGKSARTIAAEELAKQLIPEAAAESLDTLEEIAAWIQAHPGDAATMNEAIQKNAGDIAANVTAIANNKTAIEANDAEILQLQNDVDALEALVGVLPEGATATTVVGYVDEAVAALKIGDYAKAADLGAAVERIAALEAKVGDETVAAQIEAAIEALKIGDYAKAADLEAAVERIAQNEADIDVLQTNFTSLNGQVDELDGFFQELTNTKANKNDLAAIATTGNVNDLVQTEGDVLIFDCGTSAE